MTVLAWDGETFAADKRANSSGLCYTVTKIKRIGDSLVGFTGDLSVGLALMNWYEKGEKISDWPEVQKDKERWSCLIVITRDRIAKYEQEPFAYTIEENKIAFGSGRDFAIGAMEMGADAVRAVEIASKFENSCGNGIDVLRFS